ncbi:hypothetical protein GCM10027079_02320 [Sediminivirga luteola]|uniref:Uncharacterized protein n=1 Tax=Sediminivirga luteola TaxID=1774748 RepID=A0A8J2TX87_9MICO|nr:hypothetical protein GCM10011333_12320 [Sediminivirga luteola]
MTATDHEPVTHYPSGEPVCSTCREVDPDWGVEVPVLWPCPAEEAA